MSKLINFWHFEEHGTCDINEFGATNQPIIDENINKHLAEKIF